MTAMKRFAIAGLTALGLMTGAQAVGQVPQPQVQAQALWDLASARELLAFGKDVGREGLDPADYALDALGKAIEAGEAAGIDMAATRSFALLARDLADGHVPYAKRGAWHLSHASLTPEATEAMIAQALATGRVTGQLASLAPAGADYLALKDALAATPPTDTARITALRVNMERWRWLPRSFGERHIIVNVPAYELRLVEGGRTVARHRAIVGKATTPTPALGAAVSGVLLNPPWEVPQSIIAESVGQLVRTQPAVARARGYEWRQDDGTLRVRQRPGANNALGQIKFLMPNPHAIYVHDTPAKQLFARPVRAFSHGCIRIQNPMVLAERLLAGTDWTADRIRTAVGTGVSTPVPLPRSLPIAIVYLTAVRDEAGKVRLLDDIYGRDKGLAAAL